MIASMTAFARHSSECPQGLLVWEIRSVNHRYLEPAFRLPEALRELETELREALRSRLARGKLDCQLRLQGGFESGSELVINQSLARQLVDAAQAVARVAGKSAGPIDPLTVLQWPGVLTAAEVDQDPLRRQALKGFHHCLDQLVAHRQREGQELAGFIQQRLDTIRELAEAIQRQLPSLLGAQHQRLQERLATFRTELDPDRLEQEMALLAARADIAEELDRLQTHLLEVERSLRQGSPCGRRLDFLMQELNREANTLSSKSQASVTTQAAVEMKVLIEQMREQVQNIE